MGSPDILTTLTERIEWLLGGGGLPIAAATGAQTARPAPPLRICAKSGGHRPPILQRKSFRNRRFSVKAQAWLLGCAWLGPVNDHPSSSWQPVPVPGPGKCPTLIIASASRCTEKIKAVA